MSSKPRLIQALTLTCLLAFTSTTGLVPTARANAPATIASQIPALRAQISGQREQLETIESAITHARWTKNTLLGFSIVIGSVFILRSGIDFLGGTIADAYGYTTKSALLSSFITQGILVSGSSAGAAYYFQLQDEREQQTLLREISRLQDELNLEEQALNVLSE